MSNIYYKYKINRTNKMKHYHMVMGMNPTINDVKYVHMKWRRQKYTRAKQPLKG